MSRLVALVLSRCLLAGLSAGSALTVVGTDHSALSRLGIHWGGAAGVVQGMFESIEAALPH